MTVYSSILSVRALIELERQEEQHRKVHSSNLQSYINSIKIFLGNINLTIPGVFVSTGLIGGILLYSLITVLNTYTMHLVLVVAEGISRRKTKNGDYKTVRNYSELCLRAWGKVGQVLADIALFIS